MLKNHLICILKISIRGLTSGSPEERAKERGLSRGGRQFQSALPQFALFRGQMSLDASSLVVATAAGARGNGEAGLNVGRKPDALMGISQVGRQSGKAGAGEITGVAKGTAVSRRGLFKSREVKVKRASRRSRLGGGGVHRRFLRCRIGFDCQGVSRAAARTFHRASGVETDKRVSGLGQRIVACLRTGRRQICYSHAFTTGKLSTGQGKAILDPAELREAKSHILIELYVRANCEAHFVVRRVVAIITRFEPAS